MYTLGFIGAGKVGTSLGLYLFKKGDIRLGGYFSRTPASAQFAADLTGSRAFDRLSDLVDFCDIIMVTTPDDEIKNIWGQIGKLNIQNKIICHCSGSLSSSVFFDSTTKGAYSCSVHPMLAISSKTDSYRDLGGAFFTLEGDREGTQILSRHLETLGNPHKVLSSKDKRAYHLASVAISNLVIGLGQMACGLLETYGFTQEEALEALSVLGKKNMGALFEKGPGQALTGPVERGDLGTIQGHLGALEDLGWDLEGEVYRALSQVLVKIARDKHPERDYGPIEGELKKGEAR